MKDKGQILFKLDHGFNVPLVVNCGVGVNSVSMLVEMWRRGERPDIIIFADLGDERASTYAYIHHLNEWLASVGFPLLTIVKYEVGNFKNWPTRHIRCRTGGGTGIAVPRKLPGPV